MIEMNDDIICVSQDFSVRINGFESEYEAESFKDKIIYNAKIVEKLKKKLEDLKKNKEYNINNRIDDNLFEWINYFETLLNSEYD